jgi:hypothetical protein
MKNIIIVSKCIRVIKFNDVSRECHFQFSGVCGGEALRKVILKSQNHHQIKKGEEYLMYVRFHSCEAGVLKGEILKVKLLDECWDQS